MNTQEVSRVVPIRGQGSEELASLFEAVLISAGRPLTLDHLASVAGIDRSRARYALDVLRSRYGDDRGICVSWDGARAELVANPRFAGAVYRASRSDVERSFDLIEEYLSVQRQRGRRPKTIESYRLFLRRYAQEIGRPIDEVETRDIRRFLMAEERRGNNMATIASKIHRLSSLYKWLEREELIERNPMRKIDAPRLPKRQPRWLSHEEIEQVREVARGMDRLLFEVLYSSGLRVSEAVALDWHHVDLNAKSVTVVDGKGGKSRRTMLSTRAVMILRRYQAKRQDTNPWVFQSQFRRRMSKESIERRIRNLGDRAGLRRRLTPHRLRHSFARHLLEAGMPPDVLQALMGHEDIRTTQGYSGLPEQHIGQYYRAVFP